MSGEEEKSEKEMLQERLEAKLLNRHSREELVQLNIMKEDSIAPALQASLQRYQKAKVEDLLNRRLSNRPSKQRLLEMGVLKDESTSSSFVKKKIGLKKARMEDMLNRKLANRPTKQELENKNVLHSSEKVGLEGFQKSLIQKSLEHLLAEKYSSRFSGQTGEAIPLINWANEEVEEETGGEEEDGSTSEASQDSRSSSPSKGDGRGTLKKNRHELARELSVSSMQQKTLFIMDMVSMGKFVCRNCCTEFFEGPEMASPRYSYHHFFDEEDWQEFDFKEPRHHEEAKKRNLCNMCFGVCSCGEELTEDTCSNCGSIKPITQQQNWRAPDYPRPRSIDDWENMRQQQLQVYESEYGAIEGEKTQRISFAEPQVIPFERYRFRNTLTDEGIFLEYSPEFPSGVVFSVEGEDDQLYEVETETDGFYFLKPDSAGNLFVVGVSDEDKGAKNSTRVYLHDQEKNWFYYGDMSAGNIF